MLIAWNRVVAPADAILLLLLCIVLW